MSALRSQVVRLVLPDLRLHGEDRLQRLRQLRADSQIAAVGLSFAGAPGAIG
jgi:hypothetical protein